MQYFLDTEFIESGSQYPIDLISIGIVCEDGREFYAINANCDFSRANDWVKANVLPQLPPRNVNLSGPSISPRTKEESLRWKSRQQIKDEVLEFVYGTDERPTLDGYLDVSPKFWAEWGSYDWVVFSQVFGDMGDLPKGFPMRCSDIIQWAEDHLGIPSEQLPASLETDGNHTALLGARTVRDRYYWLEEKEKKLRK